MTRKIKLTGRIFLNFNIKLESGLHIGGSDEGISIGGVDKTVIRDPLTNRPYIPGSSLRGKIRSLTEKYTGAEQNSSIGSNVKIHSCGAGVAAGDKKGQAQAAKDYQKCDICRVFGVPGEREFSSPTRLIVRDVQMSKESVEDLTTARTDLPFTEVKTEVAIDRVTSAASPRQMERVPAGATFDKAEMVYSLYDGQDGDNKFSSAKQDLGRFKTVLTGLQLLEDDYLGGLGSRGSGKVKLTAIKVHVKSQENYDKRQPVHTGQGYDSLDELVADFDNLKEKISREITTGS